MYLVTYSVFSVYFEASPVRWPFLSLSRSDRNPIINLELMSRLMSSTTAYSGAVQRRTPAWQNAPLAPSSGAIGLATLPATFGTSRSYMYQASVAVCHLLLNLWYQVK